MLCENCGKNYANVRYTQIINGNKKELSLCEECSKKLGIDHLSFDMPIDFSSYLSDFFGEYENESILPILNNINQLECSNCKTTFEEFMNKGKFGCKDCYETFKEKIDPLLKNIHGANRHIGRLGQIKENRQVLEKTDVKDNLNEIKENDKLIQLKNQLKEAVKDERYEDAAKIRDEIKNLEKN